MKFEEKIKRIEEITLLLQKDSTDLEKAIELYEEGIKLSNEVEKKLQNIERKIEIVTSAPDENEDGVEISDYKTTDSPSNSIQ